MFPEEEEAMTQMMKNAKNKPREGLTEILKAGSSIVENLSMALLSFKFPTEIEASTEQLKDLTFSSSPQKIVL